MNAEVIAVGTELLLGETVDTNTAHIARKLRGIGLDLLYASTVGDNEARIADAVRRGLARSAVVLTTGGLGPTVDDVTREGVAAATGRPLVFDAELMAQIEERFRRWGRTPSDNNRRQAFRPEGAIAIPNPVGTAPAFAVEVGAGVVVSLPGVPREMEFLLEGAVLPYLRQRFDLTATIMVRLLHVAGLGESVVDQHVDDLEKLSNPTVGLAAHSGVVDVRITAKAGSQAEAEGMIAEVEQTVRARLGDSIFGADDDTLEGAALAALAERGETVAVVESGTFGRLAGRLAKADRGRGLLRSGRIISPAEWPPDAEELARTAAAEAGASCGLACQVIPLEKEVEIAIGYWHASGGKRSSRLFGGHAALAPEWAANLALYRLWRTSQASQD